MARCLFLDLCQELRDIIYDYALTEDEQGNPPPEPSLKNNPDTTTTTTTQSLALDSGDGAARWQFHCTTLSPSRPTWLALMACNRQLRTEVSGYLNRSASRRNPNSAPAPAKAHIHLAYPHCTTTIQAPSLQPQQLHTLHITLSLTNLYHTTTLPPSKALSTALWTVITRYSTHGPRLTREKALRTPLRLATIWIHLDGPLQRDMQFGYGNPWMQMQSHYSCLKWGVGELAQVAEAADSGAGVQGIEMRFGERRGWERVFGTEKAAEGGHVRGVEDAICGVVRR